MLSKAVADALSESELEEARVRYLGRKSELAQALRGVRDRESGMLLNGIRSRLEQAVAARDEELLRLTQIRREIEDIFLGLGYEVWDGPEVVTVWENFDALNTDLGHPSRSKLDTFYLDDDTILRTQTSPDQIKAMLTRKPPIYMVS